MNLGWHSLLSLIINENFSNATQSLSERKHWSNSLDSSEKRILLPVPVTNMPLASRRELHSFQDAFRLLSDDQIHQQIDKSIHKRESQLSS